MNQNDKYKMHMSINISGLRVEALIITMVLIF